MTNFCERCNGSGWADASCVRLCDDCNGNGVAEPTELHSLKAENASMRLQVDTLAGWYANSLNKIRLLSDALALISDTTDDELAQFAADEALASISNSSPENS